VKRLLAALGFLTVVPLPARFGDPSILARSVPFFAIVGLLIGMVVAALDAGFVRCLPIPVATVLTGTALVAASGGLHLDGLADTADGFFSSRSRERMLEIMKDSRTGPLGVATVALLLALKLAAIGTLPSELRTRALVLIPLAGRSAIVVNMAVLRYARKEDGLGTIFASGRHRGSVAVCICLLAAVGWWSDGERGLLAGGASLVGALLLAAYSQRKIGGFTGDTLGATCEVVEIIPALVMSAHTGEAAG
jgi:adenosylcobinamide-GDP ribazoletransferase